MMFIAFLNLHAHQVVLLCPSECISLFLVRIMSGVLKWLKEMEMSTLLPLSACEMNDKHKV